MDIPIRRKTLHALLAVLFGLPALAVSVVPFRSAGSFWPDHGFLFPLIGVYGVFFREGLLSLPFAYEWVLVCLVYVWALRARARSSPVRAWVAWSLLFRFVLVYITLRVLLVPVLASTVILYRNAQASGAMALAILMLHGAARWRRRAERSAASLGVIALALLALSLSMTKTLAQYPPEPYGLTVGAILGLAWWAMFLRRLQGARRFSRYALASLVWFSLTLLLLVPDILAGYRAFLLAGPKVRWVTRQESGCYDIVPWHREGLLFAAQNRIARYTPGEDRNPVLGEAFVGGQRLDMDPERRRLFMPSFMRYDPEEERFGDVYIYSFDLELLETLRLPECVGPLYVQYSRRRDQLYYSCEASGHLTRYDFQQGEYRRFGSYLSPNHLLLNEEEDRLFVSPILEATLDVYDLDTLERTVASPVVPPVYVCVTDARRGHLYVARFVLGDVEIRDLQTLRVLSHIRLDMGPRDMDRDREGRRLFTCSYFTGTLCVVDLESGSVGRLYAGPRARGLFYDPEADRLYFCSTLGIGFYDREALAEPVPARGVAAGLGDLARDLFQAGGVSRLFQFLSLFRTLV